MCQRLPPEPIPSVVEGVRHFWGQQDLGGILLFNVPSDTLVLQV